MTGLFIFNSQNFLILKYLFCLYILAFSDSLSLHISIVYISLYCCEQSEPSSKITGKSRLLLFFFFTDINFSEKCNHLHLLSCFIYVALRLTSLGKIVYIFKGDFS